MSGEGNERALAAGGGEGCELGRMGVEVAFAWTGIASPASSLLALEVG